MRRVAKRAGVILLGVVMALLVLEGFLRATNLSSDNFWQPDPILGHFHIPGQRGVWRLGCFDAPVEINSKGFRDREYPYEKGPGRSRVVVLGDSMTEALQVKLEEIYPKLLERLLNNGRPGGTVEVLSLAVSGYGTAQQYLLLKHRGLQFRPDVVVLPVFPINDVRESSLRLEGRADKPYFYFDRPGQLALRPFQYPPPYYALKRFVRSFHLYRFYGARLARLDVAREFLLWTGIGTQINPELDQELRGRRSADVPFDLQIYLKEYPPEWREAWDVVSAIVRQLREESRQAGARLLLVGLPSILEVVEQDKVQSQYPSFSADRFDTESPYRLLESVAAGYGIPYVSLLPAFRSEARSGRNVDELYYPCDLHFAPGGHGLVARELAGPVGRLLSASP